MSNLAFIFPGQGSQFIGMGKELADNFPVAREVFQQVDDALSEKLSSLMWEGEIETLTLTSNAQPALMAHSLAAVTTLDKEFGIPVNHAKYLAGHSLGEYSALAVGGAFDVGVAAKLLRIRGNAMQEAVPKGQGAMAALLGADIEQAQDACKAGRSEARICEIANDNAPGQLVISGSKDAVAVACEHARNLGVKKAMMLNVSAPFHCSLMEPAAVAMKDALDESKIYTPKTPIVANITAKPMATPEEIKENLVKQVTGRVRWTETIRFIAKAGVNNTVEAGAGKVLTVMQRRIDKNLIGHTLGTPEELERFANTFKGSTNV